MFSTVSFLDTLLSFIWIMSFLNPLPLGKGNPFCQSKRTARTSHLPIWTAIQVSSLPLNFFHSLSSRISPKSHRSVRHNLSNKQFLLSICNAKTLPALTTLHIDYYKVHLSDLKNCKLLSYLTETSATKRTSNPLL